MRKGVWIGLWIAALACVFCLPGAQAQAPKSGVYYEIFVRAFADSDGDGVGDLRGLTQKLDYLSDTLGVEGLWLMPTFPSPSYHGYDITDYRAVSPGYGAMDDMIELLEQARARGMKVLLDLVINHTSWEHPWFLDPGRRDWYHWTDGQDPSINLERQMWGGPVWNRRGDGWYYAIFWEGMPDLNFDNPAVREEMKDIASFWLELGVDGFRLDAASHIYGSGETGSVQDIAASAAWWREFAEHCRSVNPDCILVGEAWEPIDERVHIGAALGSVFHFDLGEEIANLLRRGGSAELWLGNLQRRLQLHEQAGSFVDAPFLSNHDQDRIAGALRNDAGMGRAAAALYLLLPGRPFIYYGEEIGMQGAGPDEEKRTPMLWGGDDPLQTRWRESRYNAKTVPVDVQLKDPASLLSAYRALIAARAAYPALREGDFSARDSGNPRVAMWERSTPEQSLLVCVNLEPTEQSLRMPDRTWRLIWSLDGSVDTGEARPMQPYGVDIYEKR
ncbi:MAG: alpha-amylase family glycosyl hydrolase [Clostridia bacterium]|nr:alpha-amylase family glycosyl hydrolase [Clostridia bacterium]